MPQISQLADTFFSQVFWMLVFFGLTFVIIGRGMVPKIMDTMTDRNLQITQDLTAAQAARDTAEAEQAAWTKTEAARRSNAQDLVGAAKHEAAIASQARLAEASAKLEAQISSAETRIHTAHDAALAEFEQIAAELAKDVAARVAGLNVSADDARGAVKGTFVHG